MFIFGPKEILDFLNTDDLILIRHTSRSTRLPLLHPQQAIFRATIIERKVARYKIITFYSS